MEQYIHPETDEVVRDWESGEDYEIQNRNDQMMEILHTNTRVRERIQFDQDTLRQVEYMNRLAEERGQRKPYEVKIDQA